MKACDPALDWGWLDCFHRSRAALQGYLSAAVLAASPARLANWLTVWPTDVWKWPPCGPESRLVCFGCLSCDVVSSNALGCPRWCSTPSPQWTRSTFHVIYLTSVTVLFVFFCLYLVLYNIVFWLVVLCFVRYVSYGAVLCCDPH